MRQTRTHVKRQYKYPSEVFSELQNINSFHERVEYLKSNQSFAIRTILQCNFTPTIILDLPEGNAPFNRDSMPIEQSRARIDKAIKVLGRLVLPASGIPSVGLSRIKKERLFIQLLESINENDADVIVAMKDKKLTKMYSAVTSQLAKKSFPDLFA